MPRKKNATRNSNANQKRRVNALRIASQHLDTLPVSLNTQLTTRKISLAHPRLSDDYWKKVWNKKNVSNNTLYQLDVMLSNQDITIRQIPPHMLKKYIERLGDESNIFEHTPTEDYTYLIELSKKPNPHLYKRMIVSTAYIDPKSPHIKEILRLLIMYSSKHPDLLAEISALWIYHTHGTVILPEFFRIVATLPKKTFDVPARATNTQILEISDAISHVYLKNGSQNTLLLMLNLLAGLKHV